MDIISVLIGLGIIGTMFIGGIMGFVANSRITQLENKIRHLQLQLRGLKSTQTPLIKPAEPVDPIKAPKVTPTVPKAPETNKFPLANKP